MSDMFDDPIFRRGGAEEPVDLDSDSVGSPPDEPPPDEPPPNDGAAPKTEDYAGWLSDANVSELLVNRVLRGKYCWTDGLGWMQWDGRKWSRTATENITEQSRRFANQLVIDVIARGAGPDIVKAYIRRLSAGAVRAAADLAKGQLLIKFEKFDRHPHLLNVANGVVDLRTGVLGKHDPALLLTKCAPTNYVAEAAHSDWTTALQALPADVVEWMQLRFGQAITGHPTPDDVLPVLQGGGENGKTTIMIGITTTLGEYATIVPDRVLLSNPGDHPTELMTLRGARLALLEETPEARHLNVKRLKDVLGTPMMTARLIRHDSVSWEATHSLFVSTNYRPRVEETDHGTWRRLALVKFRITFRKAHENLTGPNDRHGDPTLRDRIKLGHDGRHEAILRWLVDGARRWYQDGCVMAPPPRTVIDDTRAWRYQSDLILHWFDDTLVADKAYCIPGVDQYEAFTEWLDANGHRKWTSQTFADRFGQHDEILAQRITHDRVRLSTTNHKVDRKPINTSHPDTQKMFRQSLPERFRAWLNVRFRTDADNQEKVPDQPKQDFGTVGTDDLVKPPIDTRMGVYPDHPSQPSRSVPAGLETATETGTQLNNGHHRREATGCRAA